MVLHNFVFGEGLISFDYGYFAGLLDYPVVMK